MESLVVHGTESDEHASGERILKSFGDIQVTDRRIVKGGKSWVLGHVTRLNLHREEPDKTAPWVLGAFGALAFLGGLILLSQQEVAGIIIAGIGALLAGAAWLWAQNLEAELKLVFVTTDGHQESWSSTGELLQAVHEGIVAAIRA